ncbi:MAG: response regulator transcription factor [Pseudomonadota bacterium]|jgi:DNA-binding response OmpR family regulator
MHFDLRGSKVLVIDSDRTTLEMVQIRLDVAGYHPMSARSGRAALELLEATRPDAIILERCLPDMDALYFLRTMGAMVDRPPPVLLVGRDLAAADVRAAVGLGVRDCLAKPFSGAVVLERLGRMLKKGPQAPARPSTPPPPAVYLNA